MDRLSSKMSSKMDRLPSKKDMKLILAGAAALAEEQAKLMKHEAAKQGQGLKADLAKEVSSLRRMASDPSGLKGEKTAFCLAAGRGNLQEMMDIFANQPANKKDVETAAHDGTTALMSACKYEGHENEDILAVVQWLLDSGADYTRRNHEMKSALDFAKQEANDRCRNLISAREEKDDTEKRESKARAPTIAQGCNVGGCHAAHRYKDGFCHLHRKEARDALTYVDRKRNTGECDRANQTELSKEAQEVKRTAARIAKEKHRISVTDLREKQLRTDDNITEVASNLESIQKDVSRLNQEMSTCATRGEVQALMEEKVAEVKEFLSEVVKAVPQPYKISTEALKYGIKKRVKLHFCPLGLLQSDHQLNSSGGMVCKHTAAGTGEFTAWSDEWSKWVKLGCALASTGYAVIHVSGCPIAAAEETALQFERWGQVYDSFRESESKNFDAFITKPFLTSAEHDSLIQQLERAKFFDVFEYDAQQARWHVPTDKPKLITEEDGRLPSALILEDFLKKHGVATRAKAKNGTAKKRFFKLFPGKLQYFASNKAQVPKGTIAIDETCSVEVDEHDLSMVLAFNGGAVCIKAKDTKQLDTWAGALRQQTKGRAE
jgi:hypothetical protein